MYDNVYTFFGTDSKVGVTMLVTSIGEFLEEGNKVLIINANKKSGLDYCNVISNYIGIDEFQNKLDSNILEYEDLTKAFIKFKNIDVIPGVKDLERCRYFQVDDISIILECVFDKYDLILIDAGCDFEYNALAIESLKCTENTVLITTQQEKAKSEMDRILYLAEKMDIKFNNLLINKKQPKSTGVIEIKDIQQITNIKKLLGEIPISPYSWQSESDHVSLINFDNNYKTEVLEVSDIIAEKLDLKKSFNVVKPKGFKFLAGDKFGK